MPLRCGPPTVGVNDVCLLPLETSAGHPHPGRLRLTKHTMRSLANFF